MKKLIALIFLCFSFSAVSAQELKFSPEGGGQFIYSNNPEAITDDILANGENPSYIMNNENLTEDMYYLYLSHFNYTGNGGQGYDVELDTELTATEDSVIIIHDAEFETGQCMSYDENGRTLRYESDWGCLNVCAGMLNMPIITSDGSDIYYGHSFSKKNILLNKGETIWLSEFLDNYSETHFCMPVHMQAKIEIVSGCMDINVAAFKSSGKTGDRSFFDRENTAFGAYRRDRCLKGVAKSLPFVTAGLDYTIDDTFKSGECLPLTIRNQYAKDGIETTRWCTNLNPQDDIWSKYITAENDMLTLFYKDDSKYSFYGDKVTDRNNIWEFSTRRSDTRHFESGFGTGTADLYEPNFVLDVTRDNQGLGCSMGNYGVTTTYLLKIKNDGKKPRYFQYRPTTSSNIIVYISDAQNSTPYAVAKKLSMPAKTEIMASHILPAGETTEFYLNVILPVNYNGGVQNEFVISDSDKCPNFDSLYKSYKPKEFYDDTDYLVNYKDELPDKTLETFDGNLKSYEIKSSDTRILVRWCVWDGLANYYSNAWGFAKVVVLDNGYNVISTKLFNSIPISLDCINNVFYVNTKKDGIYASLDGEQWWSTDLIPKKISFSLSGTSDWAKSYIGKMLSYSLIPDNLFSDNAGESITREDFCKLIYTMLRSEGLTDASAPENSFSDTNDFSCLKLNQAGIVLGMGDGMFLPKRTITRQEAAVILSRTAKFMDIKIKSIDHEYSDTSEISNWARDAVFEMYSLGIMNGMDSNNFSPLSGYSKEQTITTICRLYECR